MRITVILIFVISFGALLGVTVLRTEESLIQERLAGINSSLEGQTAAAVPALDGEVRVLTGTLVLGLQSLIAESKTEYDLSRPYSRFLMMAQVARGENGEWQIPAPVFREATAVKPWAANYAALAMKGIQEAQFIRGSAQFFALLDPQRTPHILIVHRTGKDEWFAGVLGAEAFQPIIDRLRMVGSEAFVVNRNGQVVGHSSSAYVASLMTENPVVRELMSAGKVKASIDHGRGRKQQRSVYEQVPTTNLFVVVSSGLFFGEAFKSSVVTPLVSFGVGIFVVGLALLLLFDRPPKISPAPHLPRVSSTDPVMAPAGGAAKAPARTTPMAAPAAPVAAPPVAPAPQVDRMEIFKASASAMAHEMRTPVLGILAQVQQLKGKHPHLAPEFERIEKYAREGRVAVQKIFSFAGESLDEKYSDVNPVDELLGALQSHQAAIAKKNITVEKSTQAVDLIKGSASLLQKAFHHVLQNSIESMEKSPVKKLRVSVQEANGVIEVRIEDTGEGISPADAVKVFDPFFTTKKTKGSFGLGLSTAHAIARNFGGDLVLESSEQQKGTVFVFKLPTGAGAVAGAAASAAPLTAPPATVPSAPKAPLVPAQPERAVAPAATRPQLPSKDLIAAEAVDRTLKMIDQLDPALPPPPKDEFENVEVTQTSTVAQAAPPTVNAKPEAPPEAKPEAKPIASGPQIKVELPKKSSQAIKVNIRRPGDKS